MADDLDISEEESSFSEEEEEEEEVEERKSTAASKRSVKSSKSIKNDRRSSQVSHKEASLPMFLNGPSYSDDLPQYLIDRAQVTFVYPLEGRQICRSCDEVLRYPIMFEECGHCVCAHCFDTRIKRSDNGKCPVDNKGVDVEAAVLDKKLYKEIGSLEIKCLTGQLCKWEGEYQQILEHMEVCDYAEILCVNDCGERYKRKETRRHIDKTCPKQMVACPYCDNRHLRDEKKQHLTECTKIPVPCPNKCDKTLEFAKEELENHINEHCPKTKIACIYANIGCPETFRRDAYSKHYKNAILLHAQLVSGFVKENKKLLDDQEATLGKQRETLDEAKRRTSYLERVAHNTIIWRLDGYKRMKNDGRAVFSPTFYTSKHGYRLCASACLDGDGKGKGKFVSVFISILKGGYDELLPWPFHHKIDITLLDQTENESKNHRQCCLVPNPCPDNEPFLGKPINQKNASFGSAKFISHEDIEGSTFIKDDTLYIKIMVHCNADSEP